jgi:hypothetical protein
VSEHRRWRNCSSKDLRQFDQQPGGFGLDDEPFTSSFGFNNDAYRHRWSVSRKGGLSWSSAELGGWQPLLQSRLHL